MPAKVTRWIKLAVLLACGASIFAISTASCGNTVINPSVSSFNFCWLIDCQNGIGGGAILPCGDPTTAADDLLLDCPPPIGGATNTTGTQ